MSSRRVTNVQKKTQQLGLHGFFNAAYVDHSWTELERGETCSTAEATRVHDVLGGLRLADLGITTEPRGLTETQSRQADLPTTAAVPGRSAALDVCVVLQSSSSPRGCNASSC